MTAAVNGLAVEQVSLADPQWMWVCSALRYLPPDPGAAEGNGRPALVVRHPDGSSFLIVPPTPPGITTEELTDLFGLTRREAEVAQLLLRRCTNKEIAAELGITQHTAWRHTEKVIAKSGSGSRRNLANTLRRRLEERAAGAA